MKNNIITAIALASTLLACAPKLAISSEPVKIQTTSGFNSAGIIGNNEVTVRSANMANNSYTEIPAKCALTGPGYNAKFDTPAKVILPDYGNGSPQIKIECDANGTKASELVSIINKSRKQRDDRMSNAGANNGLLGMVVAGAITAATSKDQAGDDWSYPDTTISFGK